MRRTVALLLAFAVFVASGVALATAAVTLPSHSAGHDRSAADAATVRRFYAADGDSLRTGNPPALDGVVAPEALRSPARPGDAPGADILGGSTGSGRTSPAWNYGSNPWSPMTGRRWPWWRSTAAGATW